MCTNDTYALIQNEIGILHLLKGTEYIKPIKTLTLWAGIGPFAQANYVAILQGNRLYLGR